MLWHAIYQIAFVKQLLTHIYPVIAGHIFNITYVMMMGPNKTIEKTTGNPETARLN